MSPDDYCQYDGVGLGKLVQKGEVSPEDLTIAAISAAEAVNPELNAIVELYADLPGSIDTATLGDGPFHGVPFLRKDLGATESGRLQEAGSRLFRGKVCDKDSNLWRKFKQAGVINIGRSAVPEFGILGNTETLLEGVTCNPWDTGKSAGGSSGGAAAAVAAGVVPMAHGSDGGGSIRIPASFCSLVGLLPSRGRVSFGPDYQDVMFGLVREFIVSRSVRDTATMLDAVQGYVPGDPFAIAEPKRPYATEPSAAGGDSLRIALSDRSWSRFETDAEVVEAVTGVARTLEAMGHRVETRLPPLDVEEVIVAVMDAFALFDGDLAHLAGEMGRAISADYLEPITLSMIRRGQGMTARDVNRLLGVLERSRYAMGCFLDDFDLLLSPTMSQLPPPHSHWCSDPDASFENLIHEDLTINPFNGLFNVTGQPAISLPLAHSASGLPIGIQLAANFGREDLLLRVAGALEQAMPWSERRPPVHAANTK